MLAATLISDPAKPSTSEAVVRAARDALGTASEVRVLDDGVAVEIVFRGDDPRRHERAIRSALSGASVDVVVQPASGRRKRLLLADMDSTMIAQECIDELADVVGLKAQVAAITERAMQGEIAFEPALRERVALLRGLAAGVIDRILAERITLMPGAEALVGTMRAHGGYACLVSGGFTSFTGPVAARLGFDENRANRLVLDNGSLAGRVEEPILGREAKLATLVELRGARGLARDAVLAVGDGANDLAMLAEAGLGVAFRAKPAVAAAAHARLDHGDLTGLLYLQGYRRDEFVRRTWSKRF